MILRERHSPPEMRLQMGPGNLARRRLEDDRQPLARLGRLVSRVGNGIFSFGHGTIALPRPIQD
ncbi:MAG: hypothetical protein ACREIM_02060, partial [Nitrospiraceae bacterium]